MDDVLIMLLCCLMAADLFASIWLAVKIDQVREKIEEVLRWM